jgi:hypothetical protein
VQEGNCREWQRGMGEKEEKRQEGGRRRAVGERRKLV